LCLQKETELFGRRFHVDELGAVHARVHRRVLGVELDVETIVRRRSHDLSRVGDGAVQPNIGKLVLRSVGGDLPDTIPQLLEIQAIAQRHGPTHRRDDVNRRRDVAHDVSLDQSKPVVVEPAQTHDALP
jgi:hypothetical protein